MRLFQRPIGPIGVLLALGIVAAACGSESDTVVGSAAPAEDSSATQPAEVSSTDGGSPEEATGDEPAAEGPAEPVGDHLFPDLATVNIVDGSTVNLADQLAGGDTPVLLWFWAPH